MPYRFSEYESPYTAQIAALMQQPGRARADALRASGQAEAQAALQGGQRSAQLASTIGGAIQQVGQIPQQIQQQKEQVTHLAFEQTQTAAAKLKLAEDQKALVEQDAFKSILKNTPMSAEDGLSLFDIPTLGKQLSAAGLDPTPYLGHLQQINAAFRAEQQAKTALVSIGAQKIIAAGNDPTLAHHFLDQLEANQSFSKDQLQQYRAFIDADPANVAKLTSYLAGPQKMENATPGSMARNSLTGQVVPGSQVPDRPMVVGPNASLVDPQNKTPIYTAPPTPTSYQSKSVLLDGKPAEVGFDPKANTFILDGQDVTSRVKPMPPASTIVNPTAVNDVKEAVAGMREGTIPPQLPGRASKEYTAMMAEAHRQGYDLSRAATDWMATQKHIATLNNAQQTRLNQSINALPELLDSVDALASKWKGGKFPALNKANLALAKSGAFGPEVSSVANQLDAQIADVTADLGNVYMGGNSPTDHALGLAAKSLKGEWDERVFHDMVKLARGNVQIRRNSINNTGVQGASAENPYMSKPAGGTSADPLGILGK